jgi:hypothetical protein
MGGRGRKKKKLYYWYFSQYHTYDLGGTTRELFTGGIGFSPSDFPDPIKEVDQWGNTHWYSISYWYIGEWPDKPKPKFPGEIIIGRRFVRLNDPIAFRYAVAPYPQIKSIYNGNFRIGYEINYDRIVIAKLPGDP